jgi:hypothetical protein
MWTLVITTFVVARPVLQTGEDLVRLRKLLTFQAKKNVLPQLPASGCGCRITEWGLSRLASSDHDLRGVKPSAPEGAGGAGASG